MGLLKLFKRKKEKRQIWIPWSSAISSQKSKYLSGDLPSVARCLQLYKNLMLATPLICTDKQGKEVDHPLLQVIKKPARYMTFSQWATRVVESYWLEGNSYNFIETDQNGYVTGVLPFPPGTIYCYSSGPGQQADHSDPIRLNQPGSFFYQSQFNYKDNQGTEHKTINKYSPEQILHFKRQFQSQGDLLNGPSLFESYTQAVTMSGSALDTADRFSKNGMTPPVLISGAATQDKEEKEELRTAIEKFYESQLNCLTLPEGVKVQPILPTNPADFLTVLSSIGSLNISRLFSCPLELMGIENSATTHSGPGVKEIFRFWVRTAGRAFLKEISEGLNTLSTEVQFKFLIKSVLGSDLRETGMTIKSLVDAGMPEAMAMEFLRDND